MTVEILFSAADRYYRFAVQELKRSFPVVDHVAVGEDAGLIRLDGAGLAEVADAARTGGLRFVRHLAEVAEHRAAGDAADPEMIIELAESAAGATEPIAVQVWASGRSRHRPEAVRAMIADRLTAAGRTVQRAGCATVLAVCLGERRVVIGRTRVADALSDWPGGRMRLAESPQQISRAEHKLEELFSLLPLTITGDALDLGASPGGWTRILLERGARRVHGVDPGEPAPSLARRPELSWHRTTAGEFLRRSKRTFQVIVNDMRMDPLLSVQTMITAAPLQRHGDLIIITLKITTNRPVELIDRALDDLGERYKIIFARQLHHNRNEVTVVGRRR
ncbi:SAM-dependent methyltransferase [Microlunatus speluncae]|uniref:SAM-dependent methyltransferase n=1 Tax=Microlunatus speluncae TaxID=2594267 RepID=UPI0012667CFF|nr:SAM-dependent methyltransferase [Microlunatus speluncae]